MFLLEKECDVYNYANDNSIGCSGKSLEDVHIKLQNAANIMIKWFQTNCLQANGSKFQTIVFSTMKEDNVAIMINKNIILEPQSCVKLLGVQIDNRLTFHDHYYKLIM